MTRFKDAGETVGIDDLAVYVPRLFISTTGEFASARNIEPAKLTRGIGIERMSIPDAHEDSATMAAMSMLDLMRRNDLEPERIGRMYIGTESAVDEAKAIGTYVIGMLEKVYGLGSFKECSTVELKSACIGTTHALENVCNWISCQDGGEDEMVGAVIATDIARYSLGSPGEYTQGAGSVSMLVKRDPRMLSLEKPIGVFTANENDFFRPIGFGTAVVNGKHSNSCYISAMEGAFEFYKLKMLRRGAVNLNSGECLTDFVSHILFHIPYPRMVEYASTSIFSREWRDLPRWRQVEAEIGEEPSRDEFDDEKAYTKANAGYNKKFSKSRMFLEAFNSKVMDSTLISRQVGNAYTGSIYLGLASLAEQGRLSPGERVLFGSYGSGCSAMMFSGIVQKDCTDMPERRILKRIEERLEISLEDYELLHERTRPKSIVPPSGEFALTGIDDQGYRHYDYIG